MLGRREWVAAGAAALMAGVAVVVLFGLDEADVVEVRVQGRTAASDVVSSGRVVWAEKGDVWIYEEGIGERRALTTDGMARHDSEPRFRDGTRVTYLSSKKEFGPDPALVELDLTNGRRNVLMELPGQVRAYDWSPGGSTLAYYNAVRDDGMTELHISGTGPARVRRFVPVVGRGRFINYDETRIEWSPDGRHLLVQDTALDTSQDETLYILNADGSDAVAPRLGTWARWSADSGTVYCDCAASLALADWQWKAVDVSSGLTMPLLIPAGARPALSPDGRWLVFDDGEDTPSVHVLDLWTPGSLPRSLARDAMAPVWIGPSRLAVTDTRPCPDSEDECTAGGHGSMFEPAGTASGVDLASSRRSPLPPIATEGADTEPSA